MNTLILSGVGGSSNWFPLVYPLIALIIVVYSIDMLAKYVKRRKLAHENHLTDNISEHLEDVNGHGENI